MPKKEENKESRDDEKLRDIFSLLCEAMKSALQEPESVTPGVMQAVRAFLHDNHVTAVPVEGSALGGLVDQANESLADEFVVPFTVKGKLLAADDPVIVNVKRKQSTKGATG
jgi:hypothetical protein